MSGAQDLATTFRPVAAFDFDGTLLAGDTLLILHRLVRSPLGQLVDGLQLFPKLLLWKSRQRTTGWFKERVLQKLFSPVMQQRSAGSLSVLLEHDLPNALWRQLRPQALARLEWHRKQGHHIVIISASPRLLLEPIAERLGVGLIATETSDPRTGTPIHLRSANCKGPEKVSRLQVWLKHQPLIHTELHAYGDSRGDRELLLNAAHPHWRSFNAESCSYPTDYGIGRWVASVAYIILH